MEHELGLALPVGGCFFCLFAKFNREYTGLHKASTGLHREFYRDLYNIYALGDFCVKMAWKLSIIGRGCSPEVTGHFRDTFGPKHVFGKQRATCGTIMNVQTCQHRSVYTLFF